MKKIIACVSIFTLCALQATATHKDELALKLVSEIGVVSQSENIEFDWDKKLAPIRKLVTEDQYDQVKRTLTEILKEMPNDPNLKSLIAGIYKDEFTEEELADLVSFFGSSTGKKFNQIMYTGNYKAKRDAIIGKYISQKVLEALTPIIQQNNTASDRDRDPHR